MGLLDFFKTKQKNMNLDFVFKSSDHIRTKMANTFLDHTVALEEQ